MLVKFVGLKTYGFNVTNHVISFGKMRYLGVNIRLEFVVSSTSIWIFTLLFQLYMN